MNLTTHLNFFGFFITDSTHQRLILFYKKKNTIVTLELERSHKSRQTRLTENLYKRRKCV